jgi:serine/threonine protein kinase
LPPEVESEGLTSQSQVWALGVLGYFVVSGKQPFTGPRDKKTLEGPCFEHKGWTAVSQELKDLLRAMLAHQPGERLALEKLPGLLKP